MPYHTTVEEKTDAAAKRWQNREKKKLFGGACCLNNLEHLGHRIACPLCREYTRTVYHISSH